MDWDLSVNAPPATELSQGDFGVTPCEKQPAANQGPCLYLGSAGQRCSSRATARGFCQRHQPDATLTRTPADTPLVSPRRVGAVLTIMALLWPLLADIVRALIRYFR
jgi:hypothetical protein